MKIAILTLPLHTNYGGILQAYALQTVLERMGHEVEILHQAASQSHNKMLMPIVYVKRILQKLIGNKDIEVFYERRHNRERPILEQNISLFIERYINLRSIKNFSEISNTDYDAIIVGSDQVWRKCYFSSMWYAPMRNAFLVFAEGWNIKRIAYAASFGLDNIHEYSERDVQECRRVLQKFDAVSVREDSGVEICKASFGVEAQHLIDPTMLLSKEDYIEIVNQSNVARSDGELMCYILDTSEFKTNIIKIIAESKGLKPFYVNTDVDNHNIPVEARIQPPIETWLRGFMDAKFIVTDSFHACVFSIIFGKPFVAVGNANRGMSRFTSLLQTFDLEDRLILDSVNIDKLPDLNHKSLDCSKELNLNRESAIQFLSQINL